MPRSRDILGMNARNQLYTSRNSSEARRYGTSKYATKLLLQEKGIPTAMVYGIFDSYEQITQFNWSQLDGNFVVKPSNGNAGKGILIFRKKLDDSHWRDTTGKSTPIDEILLHCADIFAGQFSTYQTEQKVIIEERVPIHGRFFKFTQHGTPDIRIIVFNHIPVMAMLRLPTQESQGKANLHQGAIGVGIDLFSGVTTHAITGGGGDIHVYPGTKKKLNGIQIPNWTKLLEIAIQASDAAGLFFSGVDLFSHEEKGPLVVELNANPGLSIQLANHAGLRRRLERVEDLNVLNPAHGAKIGQSLFAETFSDKIKAEEGLQIVSPYEKLLVYDSQKNKHEVEALINTGRFRSAIASSLAKELNLIDADDLLWHQQEKEEGRVPVVEVTFRVKGRKITAPMVVSKTMNKSKIQVEIGRSNLAGFLVGENA